MTVTINGSGTIGGISVGGLNDNIITKNEMATGGAWAPAGTVLQVVSVNNSTYTTTTSATYSATGVSASITPTSSTSKILVLISLAGAGKDTGGASAAAGFKLYKNGSSLVSLTDILGYTGTSMQNCVSASYMYFDSPATTNSTTYTVYISSINNTQIAFLNTYLGSNGNSISTITLMEIAA